MQRMDIFSRATTLLAIMAVMVPLTFFVYHLLWHFTSTTYLKIELETSVKAMSRASKFHDPIIHRLQRIFRNATLHFIEDSTRIINITFWTNIVGSQSDIDDLPTSYFSNNKLLGCPPSPNRCFFTKELDTLESAHIVVVGFQEWVKSTSMPPSDYQRPANQLWTFFTNESPAHNYHYDWTASRNAPQILTSFKDFFNLTMTYRLDSNVSATYGHFEPRDIPDFSRRYDRFAEKNKTAIFMASYCENRMSRRDEYVKALVEQGIDVEIIGDCPGKLSPLADAEVCIRTEFWSTLDECSRLIGRTYKFYLAFENSLCKDYVTEKFYRTASIDAIPVVLNAADMTSIAPPHSYIDAKQFKSPKALAAYLKKVGSNRELYNSYFAWKPHYDVVQTMEGRTYKRLLCNLCDFAHEYFSNPKPSVIGNIDDWWTKYGNCTEGQSVWP